MSASKIPPTCRKCGREHAPEDIKRHLRRRALFAVRHGAPLPPNPDGRGILCSVCLWDALTSLCNEPDGPEAGE